MQNFKEGLKGDKREQINSLGIYELRGLARALGIKSPTTKLRNQLIDEILTALETGEVVEPRLTRKGRPFKQLVHLEDIVSFAKDNNDGFDNIAILNQDVPQFTLKPASIEKMTGVLKTDKKPAYFIDLKTHNKVFINEQIMQSFNLQNYDLLCVEAYEINENKQFSASKLLSINNVPASRYEAKAQVNLAKVMPSKFLYLEKGEILLGGRNHIITSGPLFMNNTLKELLGCLNSQNAINVFVGLNLCYEDRFYVFGCKNLISFTTDYLSNSGVAQEMVQDALNFVQKMVLIGNNVNVVLYDSATIMTILNQNIGEDKSAINVIEENQLFKKLFALAGAYENDLCVTIIATCDESDKEEAIIKQDVLKISNNIND